VESERRGLFRARHDGIGFSIQLQTPKNFVDRAPFPVWLSVTSAEEDWIERLPAVTLTRFKMTPVARTTERVGMHTHESHKRFHIFEDKKLAIPLGPQVVDVAQMLPLILSGGGVAPSFDTRLLARKYDLPIEITIEVGGKTLHAKFPISDSMNLLSRLSATGKPREHVLEKKLPPTIFHLQWSHIGRLTQYDNGPLREESIKEAAVRNLLEQQNSIP